MLVVTFNTLILRMFAVMPRDGFVMPRDCAGQNNSTTLALLFFCPAVYERFPRFLVESNDTAIEKRKRETCQKVAKIIRIIYFFRTGSQPRMVDPSTVANVLAATLDVDNAQRRTAEARLKQLETQPKYCPTLLRMTVSNIPFALRQAASVTLKNLITEYWSIKEGDLNKINTQDRQTVKKNIVEAVIQQPEQKIRIQLLEVVFKVAGHDWPAEWPELVPEIAKNLQTQETKRLYGGTCILRMIFKRFQFLSEHRQKRNQLANLSFPRLLTIFQNTVYP
eukprot:g5580.t1